MLLAAASGSNYGPWLLAALVLGMDRWRRSPCSCFGLTANSWGDSASLCGTFDEHCKSTTWNTGQQGMQEWHITQCADDCSSLLFTVSAHTHTIGISGTCYGKQRPDIPGPWFFDNFTHLWSNRQRDTLSGLQLNPLASKFTDFSVCHPLNDDEVILKWTQHALNSAITTT